MTNITLSQIRIEKGSGGAATSNQQLTISSGPFVSQNVGGSTNTLGTTWTGADLKDASLRLVMKGLQGGGFGTLLNIDVATITVWHSTPPATGPCKVFNAESGRNVEIQTEKSFSIFKAKKRHE